MNSNRFPFVSEKVLRSNLNVCFKHVTHLLGLSRTEQEIDLASSLRKTIIIHTASIIEALLLWKLKTIIKKKEVELSQEWKYFEIKEIHKIDEHSQVIAGKRKKETKNIDKLDFIRIVDLCLKHKVIDKELKRNLTKVRKLRNKLHLGGLGDVEKVYNQKDLEFVFSTAKKVKDKVGK